MSFDNRDRIDFANTDIPKLFANIFIPTLLGMVFNVVFTLTDGIFVGHGVGAEGLACVNLACPIMLVITGIGMMFGVGGSVVCAIHLSQNREKVARINATQAFSVSSVVAIIFCIIFYAFPNAIFSMLGVSENLVNLERNYYLWFIPTCLFLMFQIVGEFLIRLDGSPKFAMYANIIPAVVNIIFDYIFIFPCGMGLKGAALATDIGTGIGMAMTLYYMAFRAEKLRFCRLKNTITSIRLSLRNVGYMSKLGLSAFVGEMAISVMILTGNNMFGRILGDDGVAAFSVVCYLFPVVYMIYSAVAQSAQPIISYNYGAKLDKRVRKSFLYSTFLGVSFGLLITLVFCLFSNAIISIFLDSGTDSFVFASKGLPLYSLGFVFVAFNISAIGYFQSTEKSYLSTILMSLRGIVFLVAAFVFLPKFIGTIGLWLAVPMAEFLTFVVELYFLKKD